ncbi:hypothetical protein [Amycolatopsis albispora]|nr:hypothetical protein [Amycolatopsis albispora]
MPTTNAGSRVSLNSCAFQASRPTGESASAKASVWGCWLCSWLKAKWLS